MKIISIALSINVIDDETGAQTDTATKTFPAKKGDDPVVAFQRAAATLEKWKSEHLG